MYLPTQRDIIDKEKQISIDHGKIAALDFMTGAKWMLKKIKELNKNHRKNEKTRSI